MLVIGLGNKARQGKNCVANYMQELDPSVQIYSFADELKLYCKAHHEELLPQWEAAYSNVPINFPKDDPIYGYTQILQWYGTDVARKQNPNVWVEALDKRLETEKPQIAVISDVRFRNEAEYVKSKGGYLVQVIRLNKDGSQYLDPGRDPNHISETALDDYEGWAFLIEIHDGDLRDLKRKSIGVYHIVTDNLAAFNDTKAAYSTAILESLDSQGDGFKFELDEE